VKLSAFSYSKLSIGPVFEKTHIARECSQSRLSSAYRFQTALSTWGTRRLSGSKGQCRRTSPDCPAGSTPRGKSTIHLLRAVSCYPRILFRVLDDSFRTENTVSTSRGLCT
jgi:hypothetical protein